MSSEAFGPFAYLQRMHLEVEEGDEEGEDFDFEESDEEGKLYSTLFTCLPVTLQWLKGQRNS